MKIIYLNRGMESMVDDEDFDKLNKLHWNLFPHGNNFYARTAIYDKEFYSLNKKTRIRHKLLHRLVMNISDPKILIDHIDGNGLNNQKSNLRICTGTQNMGNRKKNINGSSRFKGVDRKSTRLNSSHIQKSRMPSSA